MKSQDIVILLKLISLLQKDRIEHYHEEGNISDQYSVRSLGYNLGISKSEINYSINRSVYSGLIIMDRELNYPKVNFKAAFEFIVHGLKYVFPVKPGALARGVATAFAAPVLEGRLMSAGENIFVWPDAKGNDSGQSIEPLFKSVPLAVQQDDRLYAYLALVDAIRLGSPRESNIAIDELKMRLLAHE